MDLDHDLDETNWGVVRCYGHVARVEGRTAIVTVDGDLMPPLHVCFLGPPPTIGAQVVVETGIQRI